MAYYDALIAKWATLTPGTTAQKLAQINAMTVNAASSTPAIIPTYKIYNSIVPSDFVTLSANNQQRIRDILTMGTVDASPGTNVRSVVQNIFANTATLTVLATLVAPYDSPQVSWWQSAGYTSPISQNDLTAAGGLT